MNPSDATLTAITHQLLENRTAENLQFWIVYGVLAAVFAAMVAVVTAYFMERGKLLAATNTLAGRLDELRSTTDASETVRTQIAHSDWTVKEFKTLQRVKLELLVTALYNLLPHMRLESMYPEMDVKPESESAPFMTQIELLSLLYFRALKDDTTALAISHHQFIDHSYRSMANIYGLRKAHESAQLALVALQEDLGQTPEKAFALGHYQQTKDALIDGLTKHTHDCVALIAAVTAKVRPLQSSASTMMASLIKPTA